MVGGVHAKWKTGTMCICKGCLCLCSVLNIMFPSFLSSIASGGSARPLHLIFSSRHGLFRHSPIMASALEKLTFRLVGLLSGSRGSACWWTDAIQGVKGLRALECGRK
jgi:hypothetical protein